MLWDPWVMACGLQGHMLVPHGLSYTRLRLAGVSGGL